MRLLSLVSTAALLSTGLFSAMPALGHQGAHPEAAPRQDQSAPGKPAPKPKKTALAEAQSNERFCMKNQDGKVHCIPFGAH